MNMTFRLHFRKIEIFQSYKKYSLTLSGKLDWHLFLMILSLGFPPSGSTDGLVVVPEANGNVGKVSRRCSSQGTVPHVDQKRSLVNDLGALRGCWYFLRVSGWYGLSWGFGVGHSLKKFKFCTAWLCKISLEIFILCCYDTSNNINLGFAWLSRHPASNCCFTSK